MTKVFGVIGAAGFVKTGPGRLVMNGTSVQGLATVSEGLLVEIIRAVAG